jgi:hypothetical protein
MRFQIIDGSGNRWRRQVQLARGTGQTLAIHHGDEDVDKVKAVHNIPFRGRVN